MSRVLVIAPIPRFDVRPASAHGQVEFLFESPVDVNPFNGQATLELIIKRLEDVQFNPSKDKIAMTGPVAVVSMFLLAASELAEDGIVQILVFDARSAQYRQRSLDPQKS